MLESRQRRRSLRTPFLVAMLRVLGWAARRASWSTCQRWGRRLGRIGWRLLRRHRRRALRHLAIAFPDRDAAARRVIARTSFEHLGTLLVEYLHLVPHGCRGVADHVSVVGRDIVERAREDDRPILVVTGHCGNWELLGAALSCTGVSLAAVTRQLDEEPLDRMLMRMREAFGTKSIERGGDGAARELLRTLRRDDALCILIDQDTDVDGCWVPFFGRLAYTPLGAAKLALKRDAVVLPTFIHRRDDGSHLVRVHPPCELPDDPVAATEIMTRWIERQIRRHPEQWVWMHRRWRRRPSS